ncbi:MAG: PaaI family thioesterase [Anaerolineae bacterium]|jgi:acyl-coenzyme A thioesterase PaaI-like protein|nr:PaaI family thioesterase [Anaerolineae bacterium]
MVEGLRRIGGSPYVFQPPPGGFGARLYDAGVEGIIGKVVIDQSKEGPPGHAHGGSLATLVDEVMGASAWFGGHRVLAVNLNISLKLAVPLNIEVTLKGRVQRKEGRKIYTTGELILPDGRIAVEGTGVFVEAPQLVGADGLNPFQLLDVE